MIGLAFVVVPQEMWKGLGNRPGKYYLPWSQLMSPAMKNIRDEMTLRNNPKWVVILYYCVIMANAKRSTGKRVKVKKRILKVRNARGGGRPSLRTLAGSQRKMPGGMLKQQIPRQLHNYLNAASDSTLGLPRPTGPYTIVRTTSVFTHSSRVNLFCPWINCDGVLPEKFMPWCGVRDVSASLPINGTNNTASYPISTTDSFTVGGLSATELVPATMTVRVTCGKPLQTASGLIYLGRCPGNMSAGGTTMTWDDAIAALASVSKPKVVSAAALALDPHECHAVPYDFEEVSNFREMLPLSALGSPFSWTNDRFRPAALSPIFVWNPNGEDLNFEVIIQWRVRLDSANPLAAVHTYHPIAPLSLWDRVVNMVSSTESAFSSVGAAFREANAFLTPIRRPIQTFA